MRTLIVGFSKPKSKFAIFGRLIMLYSRTPYSHCYISFPDVELISQASKGMVNFMNKDVFLEHNVIVKEFDIPVSDVQFQQVKRYAMKTAGKKYSFLQILGILIADLLRLDRNPLDMNKQTFVCSEYLGQIFKMLSIKINKHISLVTPKDIYEKVNK